MRALQRHSRCFACTNRNGPVGANRDGFVRSNLLSPVGTDRNVLIGTDFLRAVDPDRYRLSAG